MKPFEKAVYAAVLRLGENPPANSFALIATELDAPIERVQAVLVNLTGILVHQACVETYKFVMTFHGKIAMATAVADDCPEADGIRPQTLSLYYSRMNAWLRSIVRLDDPGDVQAAAVAARSLFENIVDLVLLRSDPNDHPFEKVFDWERSAINKQAEMTVEFFKGREVPEEYRVTLKHVTEGKEKPLVTAARARWWNGRHPPRWTGHHLNQDVEKADPLFPEGRLQEFYDLHHAPTCWGTHGSAGAGFRSRSPELSAATWANHLGDVQRMALLSLRLVLEHLGRYEQPVFEAFKVDVAKRANEAMSR